MLAFDEQFHLKCNMKAIKVVPQHITKFIDFEDRSIASNIFYPDYRDARRKSYCIYEVLVTELYEAFCPTTAKYFKHFIEREQAVLQTRISLHCINEEPNLLFGLYDKCKLAEVSYRMDQTNGKAICCELLLQCMLLCDQYVEKYQWLRDEVYTLVGKICSKVMENSTHSMQCLSIIYYRNGLLLQKATGERDLNECLSYFERGFRLAFEKDWVFINPISGKQNKLIILIAKALSSNLLKYAASIQQNSKLAVSLAKRSLCVLRVLDKTEYELVIINAYLDLVTYLIADNKVEKALRNLLHIKQDLFPSFPSVPNMGFVQAKCRFKHLNAKCSELLGNEKEALIHYIEAIEISRTIGNKEAEATNLLHVSYIYFRQGNSQSKLAIKAITAAKELYYTLGDRPHYKKCSYLLAKLNFIQIFPMVVDKIRNEANSYCEYLHLQNWKDRILPFWYNVAMTREKERLDPIHCLLVETDKKPIPTTARKFFKRPPPRK